MFAKPINIALGEWIRVPMEGLTPLLERKLHERLVFTNPDYEARHNRGDWIGNIPPQINCMRQKGRHYLLPRGFLDQFIELCKKCQQPYRLSDRRRQFEPLSMEFHGGLKGYQQDAAEAVLDHDFATLVGGHKSGKTVIALYTLAQRRQPTLILVPRLDLADGWLTKIENFLQIPRSEVGLISGTNQEPGNWITIAHTSDIMRSWRKLYDQVGYLILDECQRCPSKVLTQVVPNFDTRYMLGLSNTVQRKDRLSRLIYFYLGDVVYTINEKDAREGRGIIQARVVAKPTQFDFPYQSRADYAAMLQALMKNKERTRMIVNDIEAEIKESGCPLLVLTGGAEQHKVLAAELKKRGIEVVHYQFEEHAEGQRADSEESDPPFPCPEDQLPEGPSAILLSMQALANCSETLHCSVLFLAVPLYFRKNLAHAIRKLCHNGSDTERKLKIYDYVDKRIGLLENYFRMRSYNYGVHPDLLLNPN